MALDIFDGEHRSTSGQARHQVRCGGCGRFAKVLASGSGYDFSDGSYDPWFNVTCKKCGTKDGYIYYD